MKTKFILTITFLLAIFLFVAGTVYGQSSTCQAGQYWSSAEQKCKDQIPTGQGGCCDRSTGAGCRTTGGYDEVCDISNGACVSGYSCRSKAGCTGDSECGPGRHCSTGGQCVDGSPTGICTAGKQSPDIGAACATCIGSQRSSLAEDIKKINPALFNNCNNQQVFNYWCNGGISAEATNDCASLKSGACQSSCGGGFACTATYTLDPSSPPAASAVKVDVSASSPNWDCVALYHDGQVVTNLSADAQRGVYHGSVNSGSAGSSHTLQLKYGVSSVYPAGTACHQPVDCNTATYQTKSDSSTPTAPTTTITAPSAIAVGQPITFNASVSTAGTLSTANIWLAKGNSSAGSRIDATDISGFDANKFNCPDDGTSSCIWYKIGTTSSAGNFTGTVTFSKPNTSYVVIASAEDTEKDSSGSVLACSANPYVSKPFTKWGKTYSKCSTSGADVVYTSTPAAPASCSISGDFDGNGLIELNDFEVWKKAFVNGNPISNPLHNCDGVAVDLVLFNTWRSQFARQ